jgi:hypothetical protein
VNAILAFFRNRHGAMAVTTICRTLITHCRDPERVEHGFAATVAAIMNYFGMKTRTIENTPSLLMFPQNIRDAVKNGTIMPFHCAGNFFHTSIDPHNNGKKFS